MTTCEILSLSGPRALNKCLFTVMLPNKSLLPGSTDCPQQRGAGLVGDVLGGADTDEDDFLPAVGAAPDDMEAVDGTVGATPASQPSASPRTAAKSSSRRRSRSDAAARVEPPAEGIAAPRSPRQGTPPPQPRAMPTGSQQETAAEAEENVAPGDVKQEGVPVEEETFAKLRERRTMPGAATSEEDFAALFRNLEITADIFNLEPPEENDTSDTIVRKVHSWTTAVASHLQGAPDYIIRLGAGVLAFGRARQADIFLRERALLYWIAEGGRTLRFHAGDCYMKSPSGAFQQHRGVPPDHDRVQMFLMHLEGVFRRMPKRTNRTAAALLEALSNLYTMSNEDQEAFLNDCVNDCLSFEGGPPRGKGGGKEDEEDGQGAGGGWTASTAKTIMAVKKQLSYELTQDKLLHYMCEWCDAAKVVEAACCYEDCCVKYDVDMTPAKQVLRTALENCYLQVPHAIKGAIPQNVLERLRKFYAQTFWGNIAVFKCGQAAQALAKRGLNVVRLFIGLSSGGVGQPLYSTHLQAMYARNFAFFDPNIWFHEEEMRKQVEQLNGCIILTGQETPGAGSVLA